MRLSRDFSEFIESLNDKAVRYLVVGGYAVAFHGHPRYTKGLDIWIGPGKDNTTRLIAALASFGFGGLGITAEDFQEPDQIIQLGIAPHRIDLLTSVPGVEFETCYQSRNEAILGGISVSWIGLDDLRAAKIASGRYQDLADVENLT